MATHWKQTSCALKTLAMQRGSRLIDLSEIDWNTHSGLDLRCAQQPICLITCVRNWRKPIRNNSRSTFGVRGEIRAITRAVINRPALRSLPVYPLKKKIKSHYSSQFRFIAPGPVSWVHSRLHLHRSPTPLRSIRHVFMHSEIKVTIFSGFVWKHDLVNSLSESRDRFPLSHNFPTNK